MNNTTGRMALTSGEGGRAVGLETDTSGTSVLPVMFYFFKKKRKNLEETTEY